MPKIALPKDPDERPAVRMCGWQRRSGRSCGRSSSWLEGEDFDGGRITYWSRFCEYHEILAKQQGVPTDLVPEGREDLAEYDLVRPDPVDCVRWIEERHGYWSERLREWTARVGLVNPGGMPELAAIHVKARAAAGWYYPAKHDVHYVLPYAMSQPSYDQTIAHEVCHAYQRAFLEKSESHGEVFEILFRLGCGISTHQRECSKFHAYSVQQAITLSRSITPVIARAKADGLLAKVEMT